MLRWARCWDSRRCPLGRAWRRSPLAGNYLPWTGHWDARGVALLRRARCPCTAYQRSEPGLSHRRFMRWRERDKRWGSNGSLEGPLFHLRLLVLCLFLWRTICGGGPRKPRSKYSPFGWGGRGLGGRRDDGVFMRIGRRGGGGRCCLNG